MRGAFAPCFLTPRPGGNKQQASRTTETSLVSSPPCCHIQPLLLLLPVRNPILRPLSHDPSPLSNPSTPPSFITFVPRLLLSLSPPRLSSIIFLGHHRILIAFKGLWIVPQSHCSTATFLYLLARSTEGTIAHPRPSNSKSALVLDPRSFPTSSLSHLSFPIIKRKATSASHKPALIRLWTSLIKFNLQIGDCDISNTPSFFIRHSAVFRTDLVEVLSCVRTRLAGSALSLLWWIHVSPRFIFNDTASVGVCRGREGLAPLCPFDSHDDPPQ